MRLFVYDMYAAYDSGASKHPQLVMEDLGIDYKVAVPRSINDTWLFWGSEYEGNVPEYISETDENPEDYIGCGLSPDAAKSLASQ